MCTITFISKPEGYLLAMNRDESLARNFALPPAAHVTRDVRSVYPHEPGGETWIALNEYGCAFALLNWSVPAGGPKRTSRGTLIPQLVSATSSAMAEHLFAELELDGIFPFRLIGIFPGERTVREWRWNGDPRIRIAQAWSARQWFSSGLGDAEAERLRAAISRQFWTEPDAGSLDWLRRLHRSHDPAPGAFSICVHRPSAATLSYTEIAVDAEHCAIRYVGTSPCKATGFSAEHLLARVHRKDPVFQ